MKSFTFFKYCFPSLLLSGLLSINRAQAAPVTARQSDAFVDSIGVNIHLSRVGVTTTNWNTGNPNNSILQALKDSGIRHARSDNFRYPSDSREDRTSRFLSACNDAHVKLMVFVDVRKLIGINQTDGSFDAAGIPNQLNLYRDTPGFANCIEAIGGPNEYDLNNEVVRGGNTSGVYPPAWASKLRDYQKTLFKKIST